MSETRNFFSLSRDRSHMRWEKVFISHDVRDNDVVEPMVNSLEKIGIEPFVAEKVISAGGKLASKVMENLRDSNCFVVFLTQNSISSQWVNQEIGYSFCTDEILRVPVVEPGVVVKGLLEGVEYISLYRQRIEDTTYALATRLKNYINRNWVVINKIKVTCAQCKRVYSIPLPDQKAIDNAVQQSRVIPSTCKNCDTQNNLSPKTFQVIASHPII